MHAHQHRTEPHSPQGRTPSLKEQLAQSATGAALARYNQDLHELNKLAEGEDPQEED